MLSLCIEYWSANLYSTYIIYNLADITGKYYVIILSTLLSDIWTECPRAIPGLYSRQMKIPNETFQAMIMTTKTQILNITQPSSWAWLPLSYAPESRHPSVHLYQ